MNGKFLLTIMAILSYLLCPMFSQANEIQCQTSRGEKNFTINNEEIVFYDLDDSSNGRKISSTDASTLKLRTQTLIHASGFTKITTVKNEIHKIHIGNLSDMNEVDDYLSITSKQGHVLTYPINCKAVL